MNRDQCIAWATELAALEADRKLARLDGHQQREKHKGARFEALWWKLEQSLDGLGYSDDAIQELFDGIVDGIAGTEAWTRMELIQERDDERVEMLAQMALAHGF